MKIIDLLASIPGIIIVVFGLAVGMMVNYTVFRSSPSQIIKDYGALLGMGIVFAFWIGGIIGLYHAKNKNHK